MKRVACIGVLLLLLASWQVRAGSSSCAFKFVGNDLKHNVAVFQPILPVKIEVQLKKGPRALGQGDIFLCIPGRDTHTVIEKDQPATVTTLTLTCAAGEQVFEVKGIRFEEE